MLTILFWLFAAPLILIVVGLIWLWLLGLLWTGIMGR
jgi:hypothetical protein